MLRRRAAALALRPFLAPRLALALALLVPLASGTACHKKAKPEATKTQPAPPAPPATQPTTPPPLPPTLQPPPDAMPAEKIDCERLLPPSATAALLPGHKLEEPKQVCKEADCPYHCAFGGGTEGIPPSVLYDCKAMTDADRQESFKEMKEMDKDAKEVKGIGRAALQQQARLLFWDDDTPCFVTVTWFGVMPDKMQALGKIAAKHLTPATQHK